MSIFWLYKHHSHWSQIIQTLSLNKSRAEEVQQLGQKIYKLIRGSIINWAFNQSDNNLYNVIRKFKYA